MIFFNHIPFYLPGSLQCFNLIESNLVVICDDSEDTNKFYLLEFSYTAETRRLSYRCARARLYNRKRIFYSTFNPRTNRYIIFEQKDRQLILFRTFDLPNDINEGQDGYTLDGTIEIYVDDHGNVRCFSPACYNITLEKIESADK